ncbi:MAG: AzlD domain-containing protein [Coriobacteriia bacterium]|nr:AzlD domain-containing protein [Coriobacteriia bacterium]MCL2606298.1 AzlD domain-containing protein [Coriobacteriia bacterium]
MNLSFEHAIYALIAGMFVLNFALRFIPLALLSRVSIPRPIMRWLSYMPMAVMGALVASAILIPALERFFAELIWFRTAPRECGSTTPELFPLFVHHEIFGMIAAMLTYYYTKSFVGATLAGVIVFALLQLLVIPL